MKLSPITYGIPENSIITNILGGIIIMKKIFGIASSLLLAIGILSACGSQEEPAENVQQNSELPTLTAEFVQEGNTVTINWDTNLTISAEHYGEDHVEGEGHAHVYVDGEKVAGLKSTDAYVVEGLTEGTHEVKIELQQNNHESYTVSEVFEAVVEGDSSSVPTLVAKFVQEGNNVTIIWSTNLLISAEHYGADHVVGEGHAHVYVDGEKVAGLKAMEPYIVEGLEAGKHTIEIALQQNDHTAYSVSEKFEIEIQ
jgi:hypothetical protein